MNRSNRLAAFAAILASLSRCAPPAAGFIQPWVGPGQKEAANVPDKTPFLETAGANCNPVPGAPFVETWTYQGITALGPVMWTDCRHYPNDPMPSLPGCVIVADGSCVAFTWVIAISRCEGSDCNAVSTGRVFKPGSQGSDAGCDTVGSSGGGPVPTPPTPTTVPQVLAAKKPKHVNTKIEGVCNAYNGWLGNCQWGPAVQTSR